VITKEYFLGDMHHHNLDHLYKALGAGIKELKTWA
jgi:hypothetical protein